jgi:hypothetical protein
MDARTDAGSDAPTDAGMLDARTLPDAGTTSCASAAVDHRHVGCEHWVVDLDNAASAGGDASAHPFRITVTNPGSATAEVTVERSTAAFGEAPTVVVLASATILPGTSETLSLGRFELDGSSAAGLNDGTHTALSANGLRVRSTQPVSVIQLNALGGVAFSSGVALVFPAHSLGTRYTVAGWPQTIAHSSNPDEDFDPSRTDEDLRSFLTVVGTAAATVVSVTLGARVGRVVGGGPIRESSAGDVVSVTLGPFEVLNLETGAFGADFTGSIVAASSPVAVFVGVEAADVPLFTTVAERRCCADQLQVQLPPDAHAGRRFVVAREPSRAAAINAAATAPPVVGELYQPSWVRVVSLGSTPTTLTTSFADPRDEMILAPGAFIDLELTDDVVLSADRPVIVLHALPGQEAAGIPASYPGGDPSLHWVPAVEHYDYDYAFAVPDGLAFDALTIVSPTGASLTLDGAPLPAACITTSLGAEWAVHRCPLSSPILTNGPTPVLDPGAQADGYHALSGTAPFTATWSGFQAFVGDAIAVGATFGP